MEPLTERQQQVLEFVEDHVRRNGFPPTLREIGTALGLPNVNAVRGHVEALEKKGYLAKDPDKARSLRTLHAPSALSRFRHKLHDLFRTDEAVFHKVVYGVAWCTWERTPYFTGPRRERLEAALDREAAEHGWRLVERKVEPDHVVLVVEVWPNHSPQQTVWRFQMAGRKVKLRRLSDFPGKHLWAKGYVATTDLTLLDGLVATLLSGLPKRAEP
jgi:REP element-mobilizing transposase RayT